MHLFGFNNKGHIWLGHDYSCGPTLRSRLLFAADHFHVVGAVSDSECAAFCMWEVPCWIAEESISLCIVLVRAETPPTEMLRNDGPIRSIICTTQLLQQALTTLPAEAEEEEVVFEVLRLSMAAPDPTRIQVCQMRKRELEAQAYAAATGSAAYSVIIPHRGALTHLKSALKSISGQWQPPAAEATLVGFDETCTPEHVAFTKGDQTATYFVGARVPAGPYAIRQWLIEHSSTSIFALQDSDDYSCSDRFGSATAYMEDHELDLLGCHELRFDESRCRVFAIRYPLNVSESLKESSRGALLHGTMIAKKSAFLRAGGFSTSSRIASDTQFKLRAFFSLKMANVDDFLYIRRSHAHSLTNTADTLLGSPEREALRVLWERDFRRILSGRCSITESSLAPQRHETRFSMTPFEATGVCPAPIVKL